jgi:hypothetical protein
MDLWYKCGLSIFGKQYQEIKHGTRMSGNRQEADGG